MASNNPTATEVRILSNFLLSRAGLKDIISRDKFIELFPKEKRANPQVKLIYNELREGRHEQLELVRKNINVESKFGFERRQDESKKRKRDQMAGEEVMAEIELFGAPPEQPRLPLRELLKQMSIAAEDLEVEERKLAKECDEILGQFNTVIGDMTDLLYGSFTSPDTVPKVVDQMQLLMAACERTLNPGEEESRIDGAL